MKQRRADLEAQTNTLTSLAILTVDINEGNRDYLDYLGTFVVEALALRHPEIVDESKVVEFLIDEFGLRIPMKAVQLVLRRLARNTGFLVFRDGAYFPTEALPAASMVERRAEAEAQIEDVIDQLCDFSHRLTIEPPWTAEQASAAVMSFLGQFAIDCLKTHVFNTALPAVPDSDATEHYVVGRFIQDAYDSRRALFDSFIVLVKGQMYANALTCPDLQSLQQKFRGLTCYLDTPVVLNLLGMHGRAYSAAAGELIELVRGLAGSVAVFQHTFEEVQGVIRFCIANYENVQVSNRALRELRAAHTAKTELILVEGQLEERLKAFNVRVTETPRYIEDFQIDESALRGALLDEVSYLGAQALDHDVNSVRSIYVKRKGVTPTRLEDAAAILVTSNSAFAKAAYEEGKRHNSSREVSPVITDYSLANVAWLKSPLMRPELPVTETLALCYAGLEPPRSLVEKYVRTMDSMRASGRMSQEDHAVLRASAVAHSELMNLTLGDDAALTEQSISTILTNAKAALVADLKDEHAKALSEKEAERRALETQLEEERAIAVEERSGVQQAADATRAHLQQEIEKERARASQEQARRQRTRNRIRRVAERIAKVVFAIPMAVASLGLLVGAFVGGGVLTAEALNAGPVLKWLMRMAVVGAVVYGWWNWLTGRILGSVFRGPEARLSSAIERALLPDEYAGTS